MPGNDYNNSNKGLFVEKLLKEYSSLRRSMLGDSANLTSERRSVLLTEAIKTHSNRGFRQCILSMLNFGFAKVTAACVLMLLAIGFLLFYYHKSENKYLAAKREVSPKNVEVQKGQSEIEKRSIGEGFALKKELIVERQVGVQSPVQKFSSPEDQENKILITSRESVALKEVQRTDLILGIVSQKSGTIEENSRRAIDTGMLLKSEQVFQLPSTHVELNRVLENFRVEINGSNVILTDVDGSKYEGIISEDENAITSTIRSSFHYSNFVASRKPVEFLDQGNQKDDAVHNQGQQKYLFFNVHGTNESIKNYIEFSGRLARKAGFTAEGSQNLPGNDWQESAQSQLATRAFTAGAETPIRSQLPGSSATQLNPQRQVIIQRPTQSKIVGDRATIEGLLSIGNFTNVPIRAVLNEKGYFIRTTN